MAEGSQEKQQDTSATNRILEAGPLRDGVGRIVESLGIAVAAVILVGLAPAILLLVTAVTVLPPFVGGGESLWAYLLAAVFLPGLVVAGLVHQVRSIPEPLRWLLVFSPGLAVLAFAMTVTGAQSDLAGVLIWTGYGLLAAGPSVPLLFPSKRKDPAKIGVGIVVVAGAILVFAFLLSISVGRAFLFRFFTFFFTSHLMILMTGVLLLTEGTIPAPTEEPIERLADPLRDRIDDYYVDQRIDGEDRDRWRETLDQLRTRYRDEIRNLLPAIRLRRHAKVLGAFAVTFLFIGIPLAGGTALLDARRRQGDLDMYRDPDPRDQSEASQIRSLTRMAGNAGTLVGWGATFLGAGVMARLLAAERREGHRGRLAEIRDRVEVVNDEVLAAARGDDEDPTPT